MWEVSRLKSGTGYLEGENTADEEQNDEDQADVAESGDLILVREVFRLRREKDVGGVPRQCHA